MTIGSYALVIDNEVIEGSNLYGTTLQEGRSTQYVLFENDEAAEDAAAEHWRGMDADELVAMLSAEKIVELWEMGISKDDWIEQNVGADEEFGGESPLDVTPMLEYVKREFPALADWIDEIDATCGSDYSVLEDVEEPGFADVEMDEDEENVITPDYDVDDQNRVIELLRGWQELIDDLGFTPTIAYKN